MVQKNELSRSEAIEQIAAQLDRPISLDEFTERVLSIWPSKAKNPKAGVRQNIRYDHLGKTVVFLAKNTILPMHLAMLGVSVRAPISKEELDKGLLNVYPTFQFILPEGFAIENLHLVDSVDHLIPTEVVKQKVIVRTIFGEQKQETKALRLDWWYEKHQLTSKDNLLITNLNWSAGKLRLEPESNRDYQQQANEIKKANHQLGEMLFTQLEEAQYESIWGRIAVPTAYARLKNKLTSTADHWLLVIENDPRMYWSGFEIRYADNLTPIDQSMFGSSLEKVSPKPKKLSSNQRNQVFRFKAFFKYHKRIWRRIEIQGGQTFFDLDDMMRTAFQHDSLDHMSGFWKLVRRGKSNRFREIELATIAPFGGAGEGGDQLLARCGLNVGDRLKYVYDFGDWIEHRLELEDINEPEESAEYPRIVAQNKPRYKYCPSCREKGRETIATYICYWCSNDEQEDVIMCEDCIYPIHEDHYLEEIVY